jgi:hypothetical protein
MMTLPLQALAPRPATRPTRAAAEPEGPSFGDVFERAQQAPDAPAPRPDVQHAPGHDRANDPVVHDRPARADRPVAGERRTGDTETARHPDTDAGNPEPDADAPAGAGHTAAAEQANDHATEQAPDERVDAAADTAPGAISIPTDGAIQHAAAAAGLAAAGVVEVSNTDDPVAPAGLPTPPVAAIAAAPTAPTAPTTGHAAQAVAAAAAADTTGDAEPAAGPVVTNVRIETVLADTVVSEPTDLPVADTPSAVTSAVAPTVTTAPAVTAATEPTAPLVPGTTDDAEAADLASTARTTTPSPTAPAAAGTPAPAPAVPAGAIAATAATAAAAADDAPGADAATAAPTRPATVPTAPVRGDATAGTSTTAAPAAPAGPAAGSPLAQGDGVTPSRIVDLVERAQRESQIRRAEHTTRLGMDVATEGLGAIRIEASNNGSGLHLNLGAERQATRQLLADQANILRDELGGAGVSVDVSTGRGHDMSARQDGGDRPAPGDRPVASSSSTTVPAAASRQPGRDRSAALHSLLAGQRGVDLHL